jgi:Cu-Zn family superoxide dismutase
MTLHKRSGIAVMALAATALAALTTGGAAKPKAGGLVAEMTSSTGASIGSVTFTRADDGKVLVKAAVSGLTPGFHGFHVHTTGTCDPAATDTSGNTVPFFSAGGHYNPVTTNTHGAHAGDMPPLLVAEDGTALLKFKTDRFKNSDLLDDDGSAVVFHAGADNLSHIPATTATGAERYHSHVDDVFGPDAATKATGDAGARFACGVVDRAE